MEQVEVWRGKYSDPVSPVRAAAGSAFRAGRRLRDGAARPLRTLAGPEPARTGGRLIFRDLWIDVMVPTDGRHYRMLDLDEFADAVDQGKLPLAVAIDGLRRWQRFLDEFLHHERDPRGTRTDFPPARFDELAALLGPFMPRPHTT